jgi:hypothetical protein
MVDFDTKTGSDPKPRLESKTDATKPETGSFAEFFKNFDHFTVGERTSVEIIPIIEIRWLIKEAKSRFKQYKPRKPTRCPVCKKRKIDSVLGMDPGAGLTPASISIMYKCKSCDFKWVVPPSSTWLNILKVEHWLDTHHV